MHKVTFRYRLRPTKAQETIMAHAIDECRWLYNQLLEERKRVWEDAGSVISLYDQINGIPLRKMERPSLKDVHSQVLQQVATRVDLAFKAFFRRRRAARSDGGKTKPGYPRFQGQGRYDSLCYTQKGCTLSGPCVILSKIGRVRLVLDRPLDGKIKTCCVKRARTGKWYVTFSCEVPDKVGADAPEGAVGIDVGLRSFATLSTGEHIANPHFFHRDEHDLARASRAHAKEAKGTAARRKRKRVVARIHERIANRRRNYAHQHSRKIVNRFKVIAVEDLAINRMIHNHCLAKSIADAAWGQFSAYLAYKAAWAGRQYIAVNPAYTSQTCSGCGHRLKMSLGDRMYRCPCCGLVLDRDLNAALNIRALGLQGLGVTVKAPESARGE